MLPVLFWNCIRNPEHVIKSIGPELDIQISTNKEGTDSTTDGAVGSFNRTILVGGAGTSRVYVRETRFVVEINFSYALILNSRGYHRDHFPPTVRAPFNAQLFPLWLYLIVRASIPNQLFICLTFIILCLILKLTRVLNSFLYIQ